MLKNIKARYVWLLVAILLGGAVGLIFAIMNTNEGVNRALTIVLVIDFIIITFLVQFATFKTFNNRKKKKMVYPTKEYTLSGDIKNNLETNKFKYRYNTKRRRSTTIYILYVWKG